VDEREQRSTRIRGGQHIEKPYAWIWETGGTPERASERELLKELFGERQGGKDVERTSAGVLRYREGEMLDSGKRKPPAGERGGGKVDTAKREERHTLQHGAVGGFVGGGEAGEKKRKRKRTRGGTKQQSLEAIVVGNSKKIQKSA